MHVTQELLQNVSLLQEQLAALQEKLSTHDNKERINADTPPVTQVSTDPQTGVSPVSYNCLASSLTVGVCVRVCVWECGSEGVWMNTSL